jgi:hypothetical protein
MASIGSNAGAAPTAAAAAITVPCGSQTGGKVVASAPQHGYRAILTTISVPPAALQRGSPTHQRPWRFFSKAALFIEAGSPVGVVSVPKAWRTRAAIDWGIGAPESALRVTSCTNEPGWWYGWPGGFYLRASPTACIPLIIRIGQGSATVHFGIGRRCG